MKKLYQILIIAAVCVIVLGVHTYWLSQKNGFHVDEGMTLALAFYNDYVIRKNYDFDREYTGKELKEESFVNNSGFKETLKDIKSLWKDNRDSPHTNLYYSLLRISMIGLKSSDIKPIIFRGAILNLILLMVSFIFFFLLIKSLFPDSFLLQLFAVLCAFLSTAAISNTLFIRPYQIQETMFIIFCYYFIKTINTKNFILDRKQLIGKIPVLLLFSLITGVTLLTGYYAVIFIGLFGLYVIYVNCKEKTYKEIIFYFAVLCFGVLIALALYPKYFEGFTSYRGVQTKYTLTMNFIGNIKSSIITGVTLLWKHFFTLPVLLVCIASSVFLFIRKQKLVIQKQGLYIFIVALVYLFITLIIAPYKVLRYGMPVFPFFIILPAMILNSMREKTQKVSIAAMSVLCLCFLVGTVNQNNIENIFRNKANEYIFSKDKDVPVYVITHKYSAWKYGNLTPYFNDEQKYYFFENYDDIFEKDNSVFYLVIEKFPGFTDISDERFEILDKFSMTGGEPETMDDYYIGAKVSTRKRADE
ncbi:MAG: hypothetical protein LBI28_07950 [Treponema sp.]|jgi:hypothetical protein|nr:hypothetical protein [Treponema sp.]